MEVDKLHQAIAKLPEKQRRRLVLYYFGEFTYEQIAEMEGCTKRAVKFSVDIALKNLKEMCLMNGYEVFKGQTHSP